MHHKLSIQNEMNFISCSYLFQILNSSSKKFGVPFIAYSRLEILLLLHSVNCAYGQVHDNLFHVRVSLCKRLSKKNIRCS